MAKGSVERKAVLVLPDFGLSEEQLDSVKTDFSNNLIGSLRNAGFQRDDVVVVVVVVVVAQ